MKEKIISIFILGSSSSMFSAQMGVNTITPKATLDVVGKAGATDLDGFIVPRLTRAQLTAKGEGLYSTDQIGATIYITDISGGASTGQRINITAVGSYYFDGSFWQPTQNLYTTNGTLLSNRNVNQADKTLAFTSTATTGTSHFTVDGSTLNVDAVNNRVGIGTAVPAEELHVVGNTLTSGNTTTGKSLTVYGQNLDRFVATINVGTDGFSYGNMFDDRGIQFTTQSTANIGNSFLSGITSGMSGINGGVPERYMNFYVRANNDGLGTTFSKFNAAAMTLRNFAPTDTRLGIGTVNPQNRVEITQGSAGNSGLRLTNLPSASLLGTNANGDVVAVTDRAMVITAEQTGNYSATATDDIILYNATTVGNTLTLPTVGISIGKRLFISNKGTSAVIITPALRGSSIAGNAILNADQGISVIYIGGTGTGSWANISGN